MSTIPAVPPDADPLALCPPGDARANRVDHSGNLTFSTNSNIISLFKPIRGALIANKLNNGLNVAHTLESLQLQYRLVSWQQLEFLRIVVQTLPDFKAAAQMAKTNGKEEKVR